MDFGSPSWFIFRCLLFKNISNHIYIYARKIRCHSNWNIKCLVVRIWILMLQKRFQHIQFVLIWHFDIVSINNWLRVNNNVLICSRCLRTNWMSTGFWSTDRLARCFFVFLIMTFQVERYCIENMEKKNTDRGDIRKKNSKLSGEKLFWVYFRRIRAVFDKMVCLNKMCRAECVRSTNKGSKHY